MKRFFSIVCFLAVFPILSHAQIKEGNNFEIGGGYNFASSYRTDGRRLKFSGPGAYFEYRYESDNHMYYGGQLDYKYAYGDGFMVMGEGVTYKTNYNQICIEGLFGYTFLTSSVVNPFVGIGAGCGLVFTNSEDNKQSFYLSWVLTPRVGVQIWRFRITCDFDLLCDRGRSSWFRVGGSSIYRSASSYNVYSSIISLNLGFRF